MEPLSHFLSPPPSTDAEAGTSAAILPAMATTFLHQASLAWIIYALGCGALAYPWF